PRPPLRSTLSPYTTLFRSPRFPRAVSAVAFVVAVATALNIARIPPHPTPRFVALLVAAAVPAAGLAAAWALDHTERARLVARLKDRKSTRLNSSHGSISYA